MIALAHVTATLAAAAVAAYTNVRCVCNRVVMAWPGRSRMNVRRLSSEAERSGQGPVVRCKGCGSLVEIIGG